MGNDGLFTFESGRFSLFGNLCAPEHSSTGVVMSHGLESDKEGDKWPVIAEMLNGREIASIRFNHRGCGDAPTNGNNDGFENTTLTGRIEDFSRAMDQFPPRIIGLAGIGSSYGGMVVLGTSVPRLDTIVLMATPKSLPPELLEAHSGLQSVRLPSGQRLKNEFFQDTGTYDMLKLINKIRCPVLIIHGTNDGVVPISDAYELHEAANEPKQLIVVDGGDHTFSDPVNRKTVMENAVEWIAEHLTSKIQG